MSSKITFVGQIRNISTQTTNITYKLDDGTGTVEVRKWADPDAGSSMDTDDSPKPKIVENGYVRVWGRLRPYNNKRQVISHSLRPITDYNEIQYHMLEATVVHLHITRGPPDAAAKHTTTSGYAQAANNFGAPSNGLVTTSGRRLAPDTSVAAQKVFNVLETSPQSNEGLHMQNIAIKLKMDMVDVAKAGEELLARGYIYPTVDDNTWVILDV
jgi:replication factor A2